MDPASIPRARRRRRRVLPSAILFAASTLATAASAGGVYALDGHVIAGGGVSRAHSACFDLSGTIGEATAGMASAGSHAVVSGFWAAPVGHPDEMFKSSFEDCQP